MPSKEIFFWQFVLFCTEQRNMCSSLYSLVLFCAEQKTKLWQFLLFCIVLYWTRRFQYVLQFVWRLLSNALFNFEVGLVKKVCFIVRIGSWLLSNAFFNFEKGLMKRVYLIWKGCWFWLFTHFCAIKSPRRKCTSWKEQELQLPVFGSISVRQLCFASGYTLEISWITQLN